MSTTIPTVTDTEFAFGLRQIPAPPQRHDPGDDTWLDVARYLLANGLGHYPEIFPRAGIDLHRAVRFLGAMLASPGAEYQTEQLADWLRVMFRTLRPQGGPKATLSQLSWRRESCDASIH